MSENLLSSNRPKWQGYFKIIQPLEQTVLQTDNQSVDGSLYNNYSWYQFITYGSGQRLSRYREYDMMDTDVDVARSLDVIAEEMRGNISKRDLPMSIEMYNDAQIMVKNPIVVALNAALRKWCEIQSFHTRIFPTCRKTVKYGDTFYIKDDDLSKWQPLTPKEIIGAIVDKNDVTRILGYYIRRDSRQAQGQENLGSYQAVGGSELPNEAEMVPADKIVRFTVNNELADTAPFGESMLQSVYRTFRQKQLLEDSIIIYRITRAPERRVFKIDVGNMPPNRIQQYLESIKNDMNQKKIPSTKGGSVESTYNPQSINEDFFFPQRSDGRGSTVDVLPGGQGLGNLEDLEYFENKMFRGLRIPSSYTKNNADNPAIFNDGKVGLAYIEEIRFAQFIERLQANIEDTLDQEFKKFVRAAGIQIDENLYRVRLPAPSDFKIYRENELNVELLNAFTSADGVESLSKRNNQRVFLKWTETEIAQNETWRLQEKGINPNDPNAFRKLYDETWQEEGADSHGGGSMRDLEMSLDGPGGGGGTPADANDEGDLNAGSGDVQGSSRAETNIPSGLK